MVGQQLLRAGALVNRLAADGAEGDGFRWLVGWLFNGFSAAVRFPALLGNLPVNIKCFDTLGMKSWFCYTSENHTRWGRPFCS